MRTWRSRCTTTASSFPRTSADLANTAAQGRDFTGYAGLARLGHRRRLRLPDGRHRDDHVEGRLEVGRHHLRPRACGWRDIAHQDFVIRGESLADIMRAKENGQIAFIASLEAATPIENELDRLDILYGLGIRSSGIAYSEANTLGSGLTRGARRRADRVRPAGGRAG